MTWRILTPGGVPLAWSQLWHERRRFFAAICGIIIVTMSTLFQTGIYTAFFGSAVALIDQFNAQVVMVSVDYRSVTVQNWFPEERLFQALADPTVESVARLMVASGQFRNQHDLSLNETLLLGIDPAEEALLFPGYAHQRQLLKEAEAVLYDEASKHVYGRITERLAEGGPFYAELLQQRVRIAGTFALGPSFALPGSFMTNQSNFYRLQSGYPRGRLSYGLIRLRPGADPEVVAARLQERLPADVRVLAIEPLMKEERRYWNEVTPIGVIIPMSLLVSLIVGGVVIYQILYTNVNDQLKQYATLKAIGYTDGILAGVVLQQALLLSLIGFLPGMLLSFVLFRVSRTATELPFQLTPGQLLLAFVATTVTCFIAGLLALGKLRQADPAEVFG